MYWPWLSCRRWWQSEQLQLRPWLLSQTMGVLPCHWQRTILCLRSTLIRAMGTSPTPWMRRAFPALVQLKWLWVHNSCLSLIRLLWTLSTRLATQRPWHLHRIRQCSLRLRTSVRATSSKISRSPLPVRSRMWFPIWMVFWASFWPRQIPSLLTQVHQRYRCPQELLCSCLVSERWGLPVAAKKLRRYVANLRAVKTALRGTN